MSQMVEAARWMAARKLRAVFRNGWRWRWSALPLGYRLALASLLFNNGGVLIPGGNTDAVQHNGAGKTTDVCRTSGADAHRVQHGHRADRTHAGAHRRLQRQRDFAGNHAGHVAILDRCRQQPKQLRLRWARTTLAARSPRWNACSPPACRRRYGRCAPRRPSFRQCRASWLDRCRCCLRRWHA